MNTITFDVIGTYALLMHNPLKMGPGESGPTIKNIPTPKVEAEAGAYRLQTGELYLPATHFRECMVNAGKGRKLGKAFATVVVKSSVFVPEGYEVCPLTDPETGLLLNDFDVDVRRAVVQRSGIMRARPRIPRWATQVTFEYEPAFTSPNDLLSLLNIGGHSVGVGDYRPEKGGPFGRFEGSIAELR